MTESGSHAEVWIAIYGATVATFAIRQFLTDRPYVRIHEANARIVGPARPSRGQPIFQLTVTNGGRRPVTLIYVAFLGPERRETIYNDWIEQFTLREGEYRTFIIDKASPAWAKIPKPIRLVVQDSLGRIWPVRRRPRVWVRRRITQLLRRKRTDETEPNE